MRHSQHLEFLRLGANGARMQGTMQRLLLNFTTLFLVFLGGCGLPKDPEGTLARVGRGTMRVGVMPNAPWSRIEGGHVSGVEADFVEALARDLGARVAWTEGSESSLYTALEQFELDLVIGGLTDDTPWKHRLAFTRPYATTKLCIGTLSPAHAFAEVHGQSIAVHAGSALARELAKDGAKVRRVTRLGKEHAPLGAPAWQLRAWGLHNTEICPITEAHVMAAPPGENAWLMRVETFLQSHAGHVTDLLAAGAAP